MDGEKRDWKRKKVFTSDDVQEELERSDWDVSSLSSLTSSNYSPSDASTSEDSSDDDSIAPTTPAPSNTTVKKVTKNKIQANDINHKWFYVDGSHLRRDIFFLSKEEYFYNDTIFPKDPQDLTPFDVYSAFVNTDLLDMIVDETNRYAEQVKGKGFKKKSRLNDWKPTTREEISKFLGILLYMGLARLPKIADYWSKKILYRHGVASSVMSRNRFQLLLKLIHFSDNTANTENDRLFKIRALCERIKSLFMKYHQPGENLTIDETMIPFRGRLVFRQYIPSKRHRYGIKMFKICDNKGYTYNFSTYIGQTSNCEGRSLAEKVVLDLAEPYLNHGRTLITDNFYTSLPLAKALLDKDTHLLGTLRRNRKGVPHDIANAKLVKGEIIGKESSDGIVIAKWQDKRDVMFLSTKHGIDIMNTGRRNRKGEDVKKPAAIIEYNGGKDGVDLSDQMSSYNSPLRKTVKWYHKIAFELLLSTSVVNSWIIFKHFTKKKIEITEFRELLASRLMQLDLKDDPGPSVPRKAPTSRHSLVQCEVRDKTNKRIRKRCTLCYAEKSKEGGRKLPRKK